MCNNNAIYYFYLCAYWYFYTKDCVYAIDLLIYLVSWNFTHWYQWSHHIFLFSLVLSMLYQLLTEKINNVVFSSVTSSSSQNLVSLYGCKELTLGYSVLFCFIEIMTNFKLQNINIQVGKISYLKRKSIFEVNNQRFCFD